MSTSSYSHSFQLFFLLLSLVLMSLTGCKKKIDFDAQDSATSGPVDPAQPFYPKWERVGNYTSVQNIESDGNHVYFNEHSTQSSLGSNQMIAIDTAGARTYLFSLGTLVSSLNAVSLIKYENSSMYYCRILPNNELRIQEFDMNTYVNDYSFDVVQGEGGRINALLDLGSELFVAGDFQLPSSTQDVSACLIEKTTGSITPMPGLMANVEDAVLLNNEIYVVGTGLMNATTGVARWDGTQWIDAGTISSASKILSMATANNEIFVGGLILPEETGVYSYDALTNDFNADVSFTLVNGPAVDPSVVIKNYNGKIYAAGTVRMANLSFKSVYEWDNGSWRTIAALDNTATDFAVCQGYIYAIADEEIYRYKL